ncbi:flavin reductase family protein [Thermospira aquatica]|uniref:Flavin reductase family protein n=1 Tax=Thermospira aquatica TaxID=2828656 RepID=A0AAX3BGI4_9SPIR|nr:flavin reductase family protein [Thermospira aquatica]URA10561.1 flavin reductase family protein [Thermospira aquatica]
MRKPYGPALYFYPLPVIVVGAHVKGKPTFTTIAWGTPIEDEPPLVLLAVAKEHYIVSERESLEFFSVNFPSQEQVAAVDYCGIISGFEKDKSSVFPVERGKHGAPLVADAPLSLECRVREIRDIGESCWLVIGEVVETYIDEGCIVNGKPDVSRMKTMAYITKSSEYRALGEVVAKAREIGKSFQGRQKQ